MANPRRSGEDVVPTAAPEREAPTDYGSLSTHVASVLEAAEQAGERLREEARADAEHVRQLAQQEAAAKITEASQEASKILHEAEGLRSEAGNTSAVTRERADEYAAKRRKDADDEARKVLETAEQIASRQHSEMAEREQALGVRLEFTEKRLRDLVSGLRELAAHLEGLLAPTAEGRETLDEALRESVRAESASESA